MFDKIALALEEENPSFPLTVDGITLSPGNVQVKAKYHVDTAAQDQGYMEPLFVMGCDIAVPEYVKYRSDVEEDRIWLNIHELAQLHNQQTEAMPKVYRRTWNPVTLGNDYVDTGRRCDSVQDDTWAAFGNGEMGLLPITPFPPCFACQSVQLDGARYHVCHNMTFQTKHVLTTNGVGGALKFVAPEWGNSDFSHISWQDSEIRSFLNTFPSQSQPVPTVMGRATLPLRFRHQNGLLQNLVPTVDYTWHPTEEQLREFSDGEFSNLTVGEIAYEYMLLDDNMVGEQHVMETNSFWLPSNYTVGCLGAHEDSPFACNGDFYLDLMVVTCYDESICTFSSLDSWSFPFGVYQMRLNQDGTVGDGASCGFWTRSSHVVDAESLRVGFVATSRSFESTFPNQDHDLQE